MLVIDTSALISLSSIDLLETVLEEFDVHTTELVIEELNETSEYQDRHAEAAEQVLNHKSVIKTHDIEVESFESSRVDRGEYSCVVLAEKLGVEFVLTDDFRALPELKALVSAQVAISPVMLKALVKKDKLTEEDAQEMLETLAENRNWLGSPIYRRAKDIFQ